MKKSALLAFTATAMAASLAAAGMPSGGSSSKLGFLFAVRNLDCGDDSCEGRFETRLLVIDGEQMRVAAQTPHLYVPRNSGFWEVGAILPKSASKDRTGSRQQGSEGETQEGQESSWFDWRLWAAPIGKNPTLPPPSSEESASPEESGNEIRRISLSWVGTDYVSFTQQIGEYTEGHLILPIDGIARNVAREPWKPTIAETAYKKDLADCVDDASDFNTRTFLEGAEQGWGILRGHMRWEFTWSFGYSAGAARGYSTACATSLRPPKELVGNDALGVGWNQVLPKVPDARTAFSSPDRSSILVITGNQVLALKRDGNALAGPYARVFLPSGEIVSAQWAVGKYADAWAEQLSHAKSWLDKHQTDGR